MSKISKSEQKEKFDQLVELGVVTKSRHGEYVHTHIEENDVDTLERLENLDVGENCVWVVGYPKTGSHFVQTILINLGLTQCIGMKENGIHIDAVF